MRAIDSKIDLRKYANSKIGMRKQRQVVYDTTLHSEDTQEHGIIVQVPRYWSSLRVPQQKGKGRKYYSGDQWAILSLTRQERDDGRNLPKLQGRFLQTNKIRQLGKPYRAILSNSAVHSRYEEKPIPMLRRC